MTPVAEVSYFDSLENVGRDLAAEAIWLVFEIDEPRIILIKDLLLISRNLEEIARFNLGIAARWCERHWAVVMRRTPRPWTAFA